MIKFISSAVRQIPSSMKLKLDIPQSKEIISEAIRCIINDTPKKMKPEFIQANFSDMTELLFDESYRIYRDYENKTIQKLTDETLNMIDKDTFTKSEVRDIVSEIAKKAIELEKSLKQSRYARAGRAFEIIVEELLSIIGITGEHVTKEDKNSGLRPIDFVIPDKKTAMERPDKAHFLSLKTSLKDRWKLVVEDQTHGQRTHLITLLQGEKLTNEVAMKIINRGIFIYIPDRIKNDCFPDNNRVRKLSSLPSNVR